MKHRVVIIDYHLGNLFSVKQACEHLGCDVTISSSKDDLLEADYAILPGVGAFSDAMKNLHEFGLVDGIREYVATGKPLMGVCLGLQLMLSHSTEFGQTEGLDLIPGRVEKFDFSSRNDNVFKVPQIQWNTIAESRPWKDTPLQCCKSGDFMYFVHSYYVIPSDDADVLSQSSYGGLKYCSSILHRNIFATQFHPEKSGLYGVNIYAEWLKINSKS